MSKCIFCGSGMEILESYGLGLVCKKCTKFNVCITCGKSKSMYDFGISTTICNECMNLANDKFENSNDKFENSNDKFENSNDKFENSNEQNKIKKVFMKNKLAKKICLT